MTTETTVTATNVRRSTIAGCEDGVDVTVTIRRADGREGVTEATLLPSEYDGRLTSWGALDNWLGDTALVCDEAGDPIRELVDAVRDACEAAADEWEESNDE